MTFHKKQILYLILQNFDNVLVKLFRLLTQPILNNLALVYGNNHYSGIDLITLLFHRMYYEYQYQQQNFRVLAYLVYL